MNVHKPIPPHFDKPPILHRPGDNSCRSGYWAYFLNWIDNYFSFSFYSFSYNADTCVASPWYYYPDVPGYVNNDRVSYEPFTVDSAFQPFSWHAPTNDEPGSDAYYLDTAIDQLTGVFADKDTAALAALLPPGYKVNVDLDGGDSYELASEDFHDMMLDNITTTKTKRFTIASAQIGRDEAKVQALHTFIDPDGTTTVLLHTYVLERGANGYRIESLKVTKPATSF